MFTETVRLLLYEESMKDLQWREAIKSEIDVWMRLNVFGMYLKLI